MKRFLNIFLLALIAICCDKGNTTPDTPIPEPKPDNITLSSGTDTAPVVSENGGAITVSFTANAQWTAIVSSGSDWCIVTPASGNAGSHTITITTKENTTGDIRTASVVIKAGTANQSIAVVQKSKVPDSIAFATGTDVSPVVSAKGDTLSVSFTASASWTAAVEGNADWCIVTPSSGSSGSNTVVIAVNENPLSESRSVSVVLQAGTASETITIKQQAKEPDYITLAEGTELNHQVSADGGTVKVTFTTNSSWTTTVSGNSDWCTVSPSSGEAGKHTITITVKENNTTVDRSRMMTIQAGTATQQIGISQPVKEKEPDNITFLGVDKAPLVSSNGDEINVSFTTNVAWTASVSEGADWCKVSPKNGAAGKGAFTITVEKNPTSSMRSAYVTIAAGSAVEQIFVRQQEGEQDYITLADGTNIVPVVPGDGGNITVSFTTNTSWNVIVTGNNGNWCTVSPTSGSAGSHKIAISVNENTTGSVRSSEVKIQAGTAAQTITVEQQVKTKELTFAPGTDVTPVVPSEGGAVKVSFTTKSAWTAKVSTPDASWCKVTPSAGASGNGTMAITVEKNTTSYMRSAYVTIEAGSEVEQIYVQQQAGEADYITFADGTDTAPVVSADGGTVRVTFTTNSAWSASVVDNLDWCTVNPSSGNAGTHTVVIAVQENIMQSYRYPTVRIQAGSAEQTINIEQQPRDPDNITFTSGTNTSPVVSSEGGKITVSFTTNVAWEATVYGDVDWCKVTPSSGAAGNGTVTITVDKNTTIYRRYANIRIIAGGAVEWISVEQQPKEADYITFVSGTDTAPVVSADGGKINISFTTNAAWTASVAEGAEWCKVSPTNGTAGNGTITITVEKNDKFENRNTTVFIKAGTDTGIINIWQNKTTGNESIKPGENLP